MHLRRELQRWLVPFCLGVVTIGATAWAADLGRVFNRIADLQSVMSQNRDLLSEGDLQQIENHLAAAIAVARSPGGANANPACQSAAYNHGLRGSQIVEICRGASPHSPSCMSVAYNHNLRGDELVLACGSSPQTSIGACFSRAYNHGLRGIDLAEACRYSPGDNGACFSLGYNHGLRDNQLARLCSRPRGSDLGQCLSSSYNHGLRGDDLVNACR